MSRSARICFSIASLMDCGGSIALISTRLTRIPHLPVASSSTPRSWLLMVSREVSVFSRSMAPIDVAQRGHGELLDRLQVVGDLIGRRPGVGDLEVQDGVDLDDQVVLGDDRLRLEGHDLFAQVDHRVNPVDVRDDEAEARASGSGGSGRAARRSGARLGHDPHRPEHGEHREQHEEQADNQERRFPWSLPGVDEGGGALISMTSTVVPAGITRVSS